MKLLFFICFCSLIFLFGNNGVGECMEKEMLSTGDEAYIQEDNFIIKFNSPKKVLSSAVYNGGYREDLEGVFNHHSTGECQGTTIEAYKQEMAELALHLGYQPQLVSALGTGVPMVNAVLAKEKYEELTVTAIVTAGIAGNAGRVGDKANFSGFDKKEKMPKPGTINIMLVLDADMDGGVLARAIVTASEAKAAALQELMTGSKYSTGLATGTGTDQIIVIANPQAKITAHDAGKHNKIGELIGRVVKRAVKEAILKQNGIDGNMQHSVLSRGARYGITKENMYKYCTLATKQAMFEWSLAKIERESGLVTNVALYIHLLDEYNWGLLNIEETTDSCNDILKILAEKYGIEPELISEYKLSALVKGLNKAIAEIAEEQM